MREPSYLQPPSPCDVEGGESQAPSNSCNNGAEHSADQTHPAIPNTTLDNSAEPEKGPYKEFAEP